MLSKLFKKKKMVRGGTAPKLEGGADSSTPNKIDNLRATLKKPKILVPLILVLIASAYLGIKAIKRDSYSGPLGTEQVKEYRELQEAMKNSEVKDGLDPSIFLEINSSLRNEQYADAKKQIEAQLDSDNLAEKDKRALLTVLTQACLSLRDFGCLDRPFSEYGKLLDFDLHTLTDAARAAKETGNQDKAKEYYQKAFQEIENRGGESYVKQINQQSQATLDYKEIKLGAGL